MVWLEISTEPLQQTNATHPSLMCCTPNTNSSHYYSYDTQKLYGCWWIKFHFLAFSTWRDFSSPSLDLPYLLFFSGCLEWFTHGSSKVPHAENMAFAYTLWSIIPNFLDAHCQRLFNTTWNDSLYKVLVVCIYNRRIISNSLFMLPSAQANTCYDNIVYTGMIRKWG